MEIEQEQLWKLVERLWAGEVVPPASDGALGAAWGWTMGRRSLQPWRFVAPRLPRREAGKRERLGAEARGSP